MKVEVIPEGNRCKLPLHWLQLFPALQHGFMCINLDVIILYACITHGLAVLLQLMTFVSDIFIGTFVFLEK